MKPRIFRQDDRYLILFRDGRWKEFRRAVKYRVVDTVTGNVEQERGTALFDSLEDALRFTRGNQRQVVETAIVWTCEEPDPATEDKTAKNERIWVHSKPFDHWGALHYRGCRILGPYERIKSTDKYKPEGDFVFLKTVPCDWAGDLAGNHEEPVYREITPLG